MICPGCGKQARNAHPRCVAKMSGLPKPPRAGARAREDSLEERLGLGPGLEAYFDTTPLGSRMTQQQRDEILRGVNRR